MTFDCPKCGAPVNYVSAEDPFGSPTTVRCGYCNSSLMVPDELRGRPAHIISQVQVSVGRGPANVAASKWLWLLLLIPISIGVTAIMGALVTFTRPMTPSSKTTVVPASRTRPEPNGGVASGGLATMALKFGSEGIGPGMFTDARSIAVDGAGQIYVGEYSGGRVQVFDSSGKFLTQWMVDAKMPLTGLAADRKGTVYVVQSGVISRFEGESGKLLGQLSYAGGWGFDDVITTADGGLVASWYKNRDDIVRFNSGGQA